MIGLVVFAVIGTAFLFGLSMALYLVLPRSVLGCGALHGRFAGFEADDRDHTPTGNRQLNDFDALRGQAA